MTTCMACGHPGSANRFHSAKFELLICSNCGFGLGLTQPTAEAVEPDAMIETPITGDVELSPTGAFTVADLAGETSQATASGQAIVVTNHEETYGLIETAFSQFDDIGCVFADKGTAAIDLIIDRFELSDTTCVLIDTQNDDYPATELGYAIRAIETGLGVKKTDILFFGASENENESDIRRIGATRHSGAMSETLAEMLAKAAAELMI